MTRLEQSGAMQPNHDWLVQQRTIDGVARLQAQLKHCAYSKHRHDTYTIALTDTGVQSFNYRGSLHHSLPGQVVVLHPDELHDGRSGTSHGFSYRALYLDPSRILEAVRHAGASRVCLPFSQNPVLNDRHLAEAIRLAFTSSFEPLLIEDLVASICSALLRCDSSFAANTKRRRLSDIALVRVREFLQANYTRVVSANELEGITGESRFVISAAFRQRYGTSPYRFLVMRRLDFVRTKLNRGVNLSELAQEAGFADQAHMSRSFKAAFGMTPATLVQVCRSEVLS